MVGVRTQHPQGSGEGGHRIVGDLTALFVALGTFVLLAEKTQVVGGAGEFLRDVPHGGFGVQALVVVVPHGTRHPDDAPHQHTQSGEHLGVALENPPMFASTRVEGQALFTGGDGGCRGGVEFFQRSRLQHQRFQLRPALGVAEAGGQPVEGRRTLAQQSAHSDVGGE